MPALCKCWVRSLTRAGAFGSRIINDGSVVLNTSFLPGGGLQNDTSLNVPAGFVVGSPTGGTANTVDNEGTINLAGGTLAGGVRAGDGGPIVNNGLITGYGGLTSGAGIINMPRSRRVAGTSPSRRDRLP